MTEEKQKIENKEKKMENKEEKLKESTVNKNVEKIKKSEPAKPIQKKTEVTVGSSNSAISTKKSIALTHFIKGKTIIRAIEELEDVVKGRRPVPMKGELPHQKGIMSGGYPKKASQHFIKLLRSLAGNANMNEMDEPIIVEAVANIGSRPLSRFGRTRRKSTHILIRAKEKSKINKKKKRKRNKK